MYGGITRTGILRTPLVQFPDALNWVLVEGKIASDRISAFLSEGRAVEYRTLSSAPTTRPPEPHSISRHDGRSIGGRLPARRLEEEEQRLDVQYEYWSKQQPTNEKALLKKKSESLTPK